MLSGFELYPRWVPLIKLTFKSPSMIAGVSVLGSNDSIKKVVHSLN